MRHEMRAVLNDVRLVWLALPSLYLHTGRARETQTKDSSVLTCLFVSRMLPGGFATLSGSAMPEATSGLGRSKLRTPVPQRKIDVKRELPVGSVSVFTLIRTDTTLDHSQKAEKVCSPRHPGICSSLPPTSDVGIIAPG